MYHTAFGVYGILYNDSNQLLVIKKTGGPYTNRYDLPGGSQEDGELLEDTLVREVAEETSYYATAFQQLGVKNFLYPWIYRQFTYNNHIAVFFRITAYVSSFTPILSFEGQDSLGYVWLSLDSLTEQNASPLVLTAKEYLQTGLFSTVGVQFSQYEVLKIPAFLDY
ncbi:NUDIX hydrolase [Enterococcus sp. CU9D]|nr:NUDIX hydrolase [Enterococcus sp. CU9D]